MVGLGLLAAHPPDALLPVAHARTPVLPQQALGVPLSRQQTTYSCGPAALRSVLKYFGVFDGPEQALYKIASTSVSEASSATVRRWRSWMSSRRSISEPHSFCSSIRR